MKKLSVSMLAMICAFVGNAYAAAIGPNGNNLVQTEPIPGWGNNNSVRKAWNSTVKYNSVDKSEVVETGYCLSETNDDCKVKEHQDCGTVDAAGCHFNKKETMTLENYQLTMATDTLFREVLADLEADAQAQYNAKLTEEQNMCRNANSGGLIGRNNMTGTYRWVKLRSNKVPKSYAASGLTDKQIANSNDIYGSFCAARVTIQSDDPYIQEQIRNGSDWSTRYFAVGDVFTCGSWIPQDHLESIASTIAQKQMDAQGKTQYGLTTSQKWWLAGATILSAGAGGWGMDALQTGTNFGKLFGTNDRDSRFDEDDIEYIKENLDDAQAKYITACDGKLSSNTLVCKKFYKTNNLFDLYEWEKKGGSCTGGAKEASCTNLHTYITDLRSALNIDSKGKTKDGRKGRAVLDTVAAAGTGIAGFLATRETMKATNKQEYDEETRAIISEFMSNVGNHIYCFIGAEEAGTFGDVVEVSME